MGTAISQDGNCNIFPLAFAIVGRETKETMIWFFQLLRAYVIPQPNVCLITNRGSNHTISVLHMPHYIKLQ